MNKTNISWATHTWNPIMGCTHAGSPACDNCYARALHQMRHTAYHAGKSIPACYAAPFDQIQLMPERLEQPLHVKKGWFVFVCSGADLFHPEVPDSFLDQIFAVMALAPQHTFLLLTKRPERMQKYITRISRLGVGRLLDSALLADMNIAPWKEETAPAWPLPNVWLGVTAEDQLRVDERIPVLLDTPAAKRFVSIEPMLGKINLSKIFTDGAIYYPLCPTIAVDGRGLAPHPRLDWVICGGETGDFQKSSPRPLRPEWVRSLREQCGAEEVPFWFKQWGTLLPMSQMTPGVHCSDEDTRTRPDNKFVPLRPNAIDTGTLLDGERIQQRPEVAHA